MNKIEGRRLRIAVLVGKDSELARSAIGYLHESPFIQIEAILARAPSSKQWVDRLNRFANRLTSCGIREEDVDDLLRKAFPERPFAVADFQRSLQLPVVEVDQVDNASAHAILRQADADYWVLLNCEKPSFETAAPRLGYIVPRLERIEDLRRQSQELGFARAFIEVISSAGESYSAASACFDLHPRETLHTLHTKFEICIPDLLAQASERLTRHDVDYRSPAKPAFEWPLGLGTQDDIGVSGTLKLAAYCLLFYTGVFHLVRALRSSFATRARILAYHRVNDFVRDPLTVSVRQFARQMLALKRHYSVVSTSSIVDWVRNSGTLGENAVAIHFDDCYQDVYTNGGRLLAMINFPACAFVSTGFVNTDRQFEHDVEKCPFKLPNLKLEDLSKMSANVFELGAHTVNHVNLGKCSPDEAEEEVFQSKQELEMMIGKPVWYFAFPFGLKENITQGVRRVIRDIGFQANFSAYGGHVTQQSDCYDLPRIGMSGQFRIVEMLLEIEGLTPGRIFRRRTRKPKAVTTPPYASASPYIGPTAVSIPETSRRHNPRQTV